MSPILGKLLNDPAYLRASVGSLSLMLPFMSLALAIVGLLQIPNEILPPVGLVVAGIIFIGALDAFSGFIGMIVYCLGAILICGVHSASDLRLICGLVLVSFGPAMLSTAARGIRRPPARDSAGWFDRISDLFVAPVLAAWAIKGLVELLDTLSHRELAVAKHSGTIAVIVASGIVVRVIAEEIAAQYFPKRLAALHVDKFPTATSVQQHISLVLRTVFFGFLTASFIGQNWYLYAGVSFVAIPWFVSLYKDHFPNSPKLFQILPAGLPGLAFVLLVCSWVHLAVGELNLESEESGKVLFVATPIVTGLISLLGIFGRSPEKEDVRWYMRDSNKYIYRIGGVFILLSFLSIVHLLPNNIF
jgi:hypothetical protein